MIISLFLLVVATFGAVCVPWFAPFLFGGIMHLIELGVPSIVIVIVCTITATMTTTGIRFLSGKIGAYIKRFAKNHPKKKGRSWKIKHRFDQKFSIVTNQKILFVAVMIASGSMIPDIFLVEFGRIKMKFNTFIIAIMLGKFGTYCLMIYCSSWIDSLYHNLR